MKRGRKGEEGWTGAGRGEVVFSGRRRRRWEGFRRSELVLSTPRSAAWRLMQRLLGQQQSPSPLLLYSDDTKELMDREISSLHSYDWMVS